MPTRVNALVGASVQALPGLLDSEVALLRRLMIHASGVVADARASFASSVGSLHDYNGRCTQEVEAAGYKFSAVARIVLVTAGGRAWLRMTVEVLRNNRPVIAENEITVFVHELAAAVGAQAFNVSLWEVGRFFLEIAL